MDEWMNSTLFKHAYNVDESWFPRWARTCKKIYIDKVEVKRQNEKQTNYTTCENVYICSLWKAIFLSNHVADLLFLTLNNTEFHARTPLWLKLFFKIFVRGIGIGRQTVKDSSRDPRQVTIHYWKSTVILKHFIGITLVV